MVMVAKGTLEYYIIMAKHDGKAVMRDKLREQFPHMEEGKFNKLYQLVGEKSGVKRKTLDDYNILGV
jgi:hypothetical protein